MTHAEVFLEGHMAVLYIYMHFYNDGVHLEQPYVFCSHGPHQHHAQGMSTSPLCLHKHLSGKMLNAVSKISFSIF